MLGLDHITRIGFGCHMVTARSDLHRRAMRHALEQGCTLIDTSSSYMQGAAETLIGQVLAALPDAKVFVVTKAGVLPDAGLEPNDPAVLEPDHLRRSLAGSLERLQRPHVDAYLLHNPEEQLAADAAGFYSLLRRSFELLEQQVHEGRIRYYGISSNSFAESTALPTTIDLDRVLSIAEEIASDHHFRFVQFPYNLAETGVTQPLHAERSFLSLARERGLFTMSNRPLNAQTPAGALRLALYDEDPATADLDTGHAALSESIHRITRQLERLGEVTDPLEFGAVRLLHDHWATFANPEAAVGVFQGYFYPFLQRLHGAAIPPEDLAVYERFYGAVLRQSRYNRAERSRRFLAAMRARKILPDDDRPLPAVACEQYLKAGIDCVLVGMRRVEYVDVLKPLFHHGRES